jgi:hypothetical protein
MQNTSRLKSVLAVDAAAIKVRAGASVGRNLLRDMLKRLCRIEALIALDGAIGPPRQILIRARLRTTGAFNYIEFGLREVHERTLAQGTPHTANRLADYCIKTRPDLVIVIVRIRGRTYLEHGLLA